MFEPFDFWPNSGDPLSELLADCVCVGVSENRFWRLEFNISPPLFIEIGYAKANLGGSSPPNLLIGRTGRRP